MKTSLRTILAILCVFALTICAILIVNHLSGRAGIDLTEHKLYTLSEGTHNILGTLNQPVTLRLYYGRAAALKGPEEIRKYNNYFLYVRDLLNEYALLSNGMISFSVIDPRKFSKEEDEARKSGIRRIPLSKDENFCFGLLATTEYGKSEVIPFFELDRQEFVEYDISRLISTVTQREKKRVGVLSSLAVMGDEMSPYMMQMLEAQGRKPQEPWGIVTALHKSYEIERLEPTTQHICDCIDYLMVIHPKNLSQETLYAIDQYVMRGGKLMVFVDPCCLKDQPPRTSTNPWDPTNTHAAMNYKSSSDLNRLLSGWGVELIPDLIAVDRTLALPVGMSMEPLPLFMALTEECVSPDEAITANLHALTMLYAGSLLPVSDRTTTVQPLLTTTPIGTTWKPARLLELKLPRAETIAAATSDGDKPVMLACRISGKLKSNFPEGLQKDTTQQNFHANEEETAENLKHDHDHGHAHEHDKEAPVFKETAEDTTVLVFADVDMISDMLAYRKDSNGPKQTGDNANLVFNAFDYLGGSSDLIAIRSRGQFNRPFKRVDQIEADLDKDSQDKFEALTKKIKESEKRLRSLGISEDAKDSHLLESKALAERDKIRKDIEACRDELRELNVGKREKLQRTKMTLMGFTMVLAPLLVLLIAIGLAVVRLIRARIYLAQRAEE